MIISLLDRLEKQYPVDFERALHLAMIDNASNDGRKEEIRKLLGASWDVDHTTLFLKLNHNTPEVRVDAIRSVVQALLEGKVRSIKVSRLTINELMINYVTGA